MSFLPLSFSRSSSLFPLGQSLHQQSQKRKEKKKDYKGKWRKGKNSACLIKQSGNSSRKMMVSQSFGLMCWVLDSSQVQETSAFIFGINPPAISKEGPEVRLPREEARTFPGNLRCPGESSLSPQACEPGTKLPLRQAPGFPALSCLPH